MCASCALVPSSSSARAYAAIASRPLPPIARNAAPTRACALAQRGRSSTARSPSARAADASP
eukprot:1620831-Pleurochrysis_carterae.AAC.1